MNVSFNWEHKEIGKALKLLSGYPFASANFSSEEGFPLIRIRDILSSNIETYYQGSFMPSYVIEFDDILIGMDGDFNIAKWKGANALLNQRVLKVDVRNINDFDLDFIFYWLQPYIKKINDITAATTVKHLSIKDIVKAESKLPCIVAQRKIGKILSTIDQTIEKTEALIAKYQLIKAGLMHDLFTRGIGVDGKLRPPRAQAPELYYETEIGWIPKDWEVKNCGDAFEIDSGITLGLHRRPKNNARPYLRVANVHKEKIKMQDISYLEADCQDNERYALKSFDLLIVEGHASVQQIGRCAIVDNNAEGMLFQNHLFRLKAQDTLAYFGMYMLNSYIARQYWESNCSTSSGLNTINKTMLRNMPVLIPHLEEQEVIVEKIDTIVRKIDNEQQFCHKLNSKKQGLMHDLLTGKITVTIDHDSDDSEAAYV